MGRIIDISEAILPLGLSAEITEEERAIISTAITKAEGSIRRHLRYDPVSMLRTEFYPNQNFGPDNARTVYEVEGGTAYERRITGAATTDLQVQHVPIRSIPTIDLRVDYGARSGTVAGSFAAETRKTEGVDFWPNYDGQDSSGNSVCRDGIFKSVGTWPSEPGSVRVAYTAGYTQAELHGQDATIDASPIMDATIDETIRRVKKAFVMMKQSAGGWVAGPYSGEKLGDYSYTLDAATVQNLFGGVADLLPESMWKLEEFVNWGWMLAS